MAFFFLIRDDSMITMTYFFGEKWKNRMEFSESLKKNRDFKTVYSNGKSRANKYLVMYVMKNGTEKNRIGISVSKKVGNSVVRHHLTRLIREIYRLNEHYFKTGYHFYCSCQCKEYRLSYTGEGVDTCGWYSQSFGKEQ